MGQSTNHVDSMGGGRGLKMSKNDPRYTSKLIHVWGGEGSEKPKNQSTWFVDDFYSELICHNIALTPIKMYVPLWHN